MNLDVASNNADLLWTILEEKPEFPHKRANLNVDPHGNLYIIAKWDLLGRLIKWIQNCHGKVTEKINQVTIESLNFIKNFNSESQDGLIYVKYKDQSLGGSPEAWYPTKYSVDCLATSIIRSNRFKSYQAVIEAAQELEKQKALYQHRVIRYSAGD